MKTVLITGASGGIGLALTKEYIKNGYFVCGQYFKNEKSLLALKEELKKENLSDYLFIVKADLSTDKGVEKLYKTVEKNFNSISVLINNAGQDLYKLCQETTDKELEEIVSVNFKASYNLTKLVLPSMISKENGNVIFISSVWGTNGACMETAYSATKSALIGLTKALAKEVAPFVRVNCITPGVIDTPMNACFTKEEMQEVISSVPLKRVGFPEEVASLCSYLTSEKASYITGAIIPIDGGYSL